MSERQVELDVLRYNPETDREPRFQRYSVTCREEWVLLDALNHVKESVDPTLSYRWSCHMAVCGSCGMMVNGEPKLACKTFLRDYAGVIRVEPLAHFPIERDLVTVIDDFMAKLARVKPYLIPKEPAPANGGEYRQTPAQLLRRTDDQVHREFRLDGIEYFCRLAGARAALRPARGTGKHQSHRGFQHPGCSAAAGLLTSAWTGL